MLRQIVRRVAAGEFERAFGRSRTLRRLYGVVRGRIERRSGGAAAMPGCGLAASLFDLAIVASCLQGLDGSGFFGGLRLPQDSVDELAAFAGSALCVQRGASAPFRFGEVEDGRLPDGTPAVLADVETPQSSGAVAALVGDPVLLEVASGFLLYRPRCVVPRLWWSFAGNHAPQSRRAVGQEIDFHYDISGYNSLYLFFYLTDADRESGAHVVVRGSHRAKSPRLLLSTTAKSDSRIVQRYGSEAVTPLEGAAGFGFFEDPACYHKALPPRFRPRLMLQIRYS